MVSRVMVAATVAVVIIQSGPIRSAEIHDAARSGDAAQVRGLLKKARGLARAPDEIGRPPLHNAAAGGHKEVATALIAAGADVKARDVVGWTALHVAAAGGHADLVALLADKGADVDAKDLYGRTPLDHAVRSDRRSAAEALIKKGAKSSLELPGGGDISRLVKELGDNSWRNRDAATRRLVALSFFSLKAVEEATKSEDAEVVWRAKDILKQLEKSVSRRVLPSDFWLCGPFPHRAGKEPLDVDYGPEAAAGADPDLMKAYDDAGRKVGWCRPWPGREGVDIDLDKPWGDQTNAVAYGLAWVFCPEARPVTMLLGSDDSVKVWLNGKLIHKNDVRRAVNIDEDKVETTLAKGWNRLLIKVVEYSGLWGFSVRFVNAEGAQPADVIFDPAKGGKVKGPVTKPLSAPAKEGRKSSDANAPAAVIIQQQGGVQIRIQQQGGAPIRVQHVQEQNGAQIRVQVEADGE